MPHKSFKLNDLSNILQILSHTEEYYSLRQIIESLENEQFIRRLPRRRFILMKKESTSILRVRVRRNQLFVVDGDEKIEINSRDTLDALNGDLVRVSISENSSLERRAKVVEIVERSHKRLVGTVCRKSGRLLFSPDDKALPEFSIRKEDVKNLHEGQKVVMGLEYSEHGISILLEKTLGKAGEARVEIDSIVEEFELPLTFPKDVLREAEALPTVIPAEEIARRRDLRSLVCFTIDPLDARDFDDAVSLEVLDKGLVRVGVHIADVSYYVREGTALEREAFQRATSVYLIGGVIPMLPEKISNDLCSLKPEVDRLAFTAMMTLNEKAEVVETEIFRSVIHSRKRFTYEDAQLIIDAGRGPLVKELTLADELAKKLRQARMNEGSIDFESVEVKFHYDDHGVPVGASRKERLGSMKLVEEFMLLANKVVAKNIGSKKEAGKSTPFVYRVHDVPRAQRLEDLASVVKRLGYSFDPTNVSSRRIQKLIDEVHGKPEEFLVNELALRSMAKAIYDDVNVGHFGLAFAHYTHFTSPIRRYPDLIVHRLVDEYNHGMSTARRAHWHESLSGICEHASLRERRATEAERSSTKVALAVLAQTMLGEEHDSVISGVMAFGIFVELMDIPIEGLIKARDLAEESFVFDERSHSLVGRSTKKSFQLGDKLRVKIVRVDLARREVDLQIVRGAKEHVRKHREHSEPTRQKRRRRR